MRPLLPLLACIAAVVATDTPIEAEPLDLEPTEYIDSTHPDIASTVATIAPEALSQRERAIRLHDFVRDEIAFGWAPAFYDQKASEVLSSRVGFCNTKSTLFVALLRSAGIPARQHFVDIDARILSGLIDPGTPYVDHSFVEVEIEGRWMRVDSFIIDALLAKKARARLEREGKRVGYGAHRGGVSSWDATGDAFSQFVDDGSHPGLTNEDHGVFRDVGAFYASGLGRNRLNPLLRIGFRFFARRANGRIDAIRSSGETP